MKTVILTILISLSSLIASAQSLFDSVDNLKFVEHTYLSPEYLRTKPDAKVSNEQINFPTSDLKSVDIIFTMDGQAWKEVWETMKNIKKKEGLINLAQRKTSLGRIDLLGKRGKNNTFSQLMLVEQTQIGLRIIYLTGTLNPENITVNW